jgi:hypothetical protein
MEEMKTTKLFSSKIASFVLKTVAAGGTSVLLMQLISFNVPANAAIKYAPPASRGMAVNTSGTGARGGYVPPANRGIAQGVSGTGARGEGTNYLPITLSLLIPNNHIGRTTSANPTFYFNLSAVPAAPVEFALVEPGVAKPIFVQQIATPKVGVNQVTMPANLPELIPGHNYRWSVSLINNYKRRSTDVFVQGWVERVAATPELNSKLAAATSDRERAGIYAEKGIFYNALESISAAQAAAPNDKAIAQERISLLEQVGQKQVAEQERQRLAIR